MTHDDPEQRGQRFDLSSVKVFLSDRECTLLNVSSSGVLIDDAPAGLTVGAPCEVLLKVRALGKWVPTYVMGMVTRIPADGQVAIQYAKPGKTWNTLLNILNKREHPVGE